MFGMVRMSRSINRAEVEQNRFGGLDRNEGADEGTLRDMQNLCSDRYPLITTRPLRWTRTKVAAPMGFYVGKSVAWMDGRELWVDGEAVATLDSGGYKQIVGFQDKLVILPDRAVYHPLSGEIRYMETSWDGVASFRDGTFAEEEATANTIASRLDWRTLFQPGDAVTITAVDENGALLTDPIGPIVIREIGYNEASGTGELRFYENSFTRLVGISTADPPEAAVDQTEGDVTTNGTLTPFPAMDTWHRTTIERAAPKLEMVFEHCNRLWGVSGSTIYASRLGDCMNWNVFDGLSTDSFSVEIGSPGAFTGCCSYGGRPMFFKENRILKIYGDTPQDFSIYETESLGVEAGSALSLAIAGEMLLYKSKAGIMAYSGGYPRLISQALGETRYTEAVAGSDGVKYYVSMNMPRGAELLVYDTRRGLWHKEDNLRPLGIGYRNELLALDILGRFVILGQTAERYAGMETETGVQSMAEFSDFCDGSTRRKGVGKLRLRMKVQPMTTVTISICYDGGAWETVRTIEGCGCKGVSVIPLRLKRCDHYRLRISGLGIDGWTLYSITRDRYVGSDRK